MTGPRPRKVALDVVVRHRAWRIVERLHITADPNDAIELRLHLAASMRRVDSRGPEWIKEYVLEMWRTGIDRNPQRPWSRFATIDTKSPV